MSYENQNQENSKVRNALSLVKAGAQEYLKRKIMVGVAPLDQLLDDTISDITTTIGSFVVRNIKGKLERSITFDTRHQVFSQWMEEALYGILYRYNDIKNSNRLALVNHDGTEDGSAMYYELDEGIHNLKYRKWNILLHIEFNSGGSNITIRDRGYPRTKTYTLICFDLDPEFPKMFERDMIAYRNSLLKIKSDSPTVTVYRDYYEGYVYWDKSSPINKRRMNTIYLPREKKELIVNTVNKFFSNKEYYRRHGIPHNLKILLYGPPGPQPVDTMIPTPIGMRRFGDLKEGDYVFDRKGKPTKILKVYDEGVQDLYEVELIDGRTTKCTAGHLWDVVFDEKALDLIPDKNTLIQTLPTGMLYEIFEKFKRIGSSRVAAYLPRNYGIRSFNESRYSNIKEGDDEYIDPALEYTIALYAICGYRNEDGTISFKNIPMRSIKSVQIGFEFMNLKTKYICASRYSGFIEDVSFYLDDENSSIIDPLELFKDYPELTNPDINERVIPDRFIYTTDSERLRMVRAMHDATYHCVYLEENEVEGDAASYHNLKNHLNCFTTNKKLIDQFVWLARSLGYYQESPVEVTRLNDYCFSWDPLPKYYGGYISTQLGEGILNHRYDEDEWSEVNDNTDDARFKLTYELTSVGINRIRKLNEKDHVMCILVDNDEHLYMTNDFIVTHNTGKDSIAKMIASEWNRNLYYVTGGKNGQSIPSAITSDSQAIMYPMFLISDIDKYPFLINEPEINIENNEAKEEQLKYKQLFASMINALDGVMAADDRIIVMTTNHIEKFSNTFLRPGRVDLKLEIGYVTPDVFRKYVYDYYGKVIPKDIELRSDKLTIAELQRDVVFMELSVDEFINKYVK